MTTALERVRKAISEGILPDRDEVAELTLSTPVELQIGMCRLIAGIVATFHANGGPGVEEWMGESVEEHLRHASDHMGESFLTRCDGDESTFDSFYRCEEDGLLHVDHAACRIVMAFAREMMVWKKGSVG